MRKIFFVLLVCVLIVVGAFGFFLHKIYHAGENNTQIIVNESADSYRFYASFNKYRTKQVQRYMDQQLNASVFKSAVIDADMVVDNNTINIHVKSHPGVLEIKLDKNRNDSIAYQRVKNMGEGIKKRLAEDNR